MGDKDPVKDIITINFLILELPRNANLIVDIRFNLYYYIYVHYYWRVGLSTIIKRILKLFKERNKRKVQNYLVLVVHFIHGFVG